MRAHGTHFFLRSCDSHLPSARHRPLLFFLFLQAELRFPSEVGSHPPVAFKGQFNPQPGGQDYVAIFDGAAFRLERITAAVNLKHAPSSAKRTVARAALDNNQRSTLGDVPDSRGLAADQSRRRAPIEAAPNGVHAATAGAVGTLVGSPSAGSVLNDIEYEFLHGGLS